MLTTSEGRRYSPSDLVAFLGCTHRTTLDIAALSAQELQRDEDTDYAAVLQRLGDEHEAVFLEQLLCQGLNVTTIEARQSREKQIADTQEALASGVDVVFQAALRRDDLFGRADFLIKVDEPSALGAHSYEIIDTKLARNPNPKFIIQLCAYAEALELIQERLPTDIHIVLGDLRQASYRTSEFISYYRNALSRFHNFVDGESKETYPEPCASCGLCPWQSLCSSQWVADDHLGLVANISRTHIEKLRASGITTVLGLSELPEGQAIPKLSDEALGRLRHQAQLHIEERTTGEPAVERLELDDDGVRGFYRLPRPNQHDLFFDIEGDPLYPDGLEYLFGVGWFDGTDFIYRKFWAHDHQQERQAFEELVDFFAEHLSRHPKAHIYHYAAYEVTAFKRLMSRYGTREVEVDNLLRGQKFVDLFRVVREAIRVSRPSYSIKELEHFYMESREADVTGGAESIVFYEQWRASKDEAKLEEIRRYNEEDCHSTGLLLRWLLDMRPSDLTWADDANDTADSDDRQISESHLEREAKLRDFEEKLLGACEASELSFRETVYQLLDFHRREAKSAWWAIFERATATREELIDDNECLGGLTSDPAEPDSTIQRSYTRRYSYPSQQSKFKVGDAAYLPIDLEPAGTILELDMDAQSVTLKRGTGKGALPVSTSLIPQGPIDTKVITTAIDDYAKSIIDGSDTFSAVTSILRRQISSVLGTNPGEPLIDPAKDIIDESTRAIANLDDSYVFIQGPPGAGKTFTASHVIARLIQNGSSVAVSSNSHRAINNLLQAVECRADEMNLTFRGQKKSTARDEDSQLNGTLIEDVFSNDKIDPSADLVAGTAWLMCRPELHECFDYLFVDEAGQISLANLVGMGTCAKNIVLIGDHMQLAQPAQGIHPGDSGVSVLEYLLQEHATIPPERGIFLPTSWRMHDHVCQFISEAVYDGRLLPEPQNKNQRLMLSDGVHPSIKPTGISYVPVEHNGCSQESEEEADVIAEIIGSLLQQRFIDRDGQARTLSPDDILVVSPYNLQVNLLKRRLPAGARIGTVDKFQGQEAPVSIVSMATSSGDDIPRGVEFLLSKNRLNVAISRAKCLSIFVANPRLNDIPCSTIDQVRLVNMLCRLNEYACADPAS